MMSSDEDTEPLIQEGRPSTSVDCSLDTTVGPIHTDPELEEVVYGYRRSRWRKVLVYSVSTLLAGLPFLVFHWCPTWLLYVTALQCPFHVADLILVVETYQKKCKSHYIHGIFNKNIGETRGQSNAGFQGEGGNTPEKPPILEDRLTPIHLEDGTKLHVSHYRYFVHKKCVFVWTGGQGGATQGARGAWGRLAGIERGATCASLHRTATDLLDHDAMLHIYGSNTISVPVDSGFTLTLREIFNPFYVFQACTIALWLAEPYYYYCVAVVLMSTFGVTTSVIQTKKNQQSLRATVESQDTVQVLVHGAAVTVPSDQLSPGDVLLLPAQGCRLHCDAVLLTGTALVNESMLTGESVPVSKTALPRTSALFDETQHAAHTLCCGTQLIQTRYYNEPVKALVIRTGYHTSKGQLVRSILYPIPADFKFDRDSYKFILILTAIAMVGLAYTVALKAYRSISPGDITLKALDIITIVVPPALPAAMTVGRLYAVSRLKRARVACLNTRAVNVSGSLDCMCFDKTGTLTEDGLDMWGCVPVSLTSAPAALARPVRDPRALNDLHQLKMAMACCHSLTMLHGELAGDPLDLKMFESTGWLLEEPDVPETTNYEMLTPTVVKPSRNTNINVDDFHVPLEVGIILQNQFVSRLARSSVATRAVGEDVIRVYCKGAPDTLHTLCKPHTVPVDLNSVLSHYAEKGYRVIALATRVLEVTHKQLLKMTREEMECELTFLGLVILENRLKAATAAVIRELKDADIHVVMITGDNIHTAISVATECGILAGGERVVRMSTRGGAEAGARGDTPPTVYTESTLHGVPVGKPSVLRAAGGGGGGGGGGSVDSGLVSEWSGSGSGDAAGDTPRGPNYKVAMTGDTWRVLREQYPSLVPRIIARGAVFARMTSDQKQQLIVEYQALGYYVGMCGDGANDCGALRAAHTGISLSELESSVAAPFTAADPDIVCVTRVLREGRAALTTSFGIFKFMVAASLTEFLSVALLYYFDSNLADFQFLFIDVALVVNFAAFFGKTEAFRGKLCKIPPLTSLLGLVPLLSLFTQMALVAVGQYLSYYAISRFPWYNRHTFEGDEAYECYENYAIYVVSMFQYVILALVFSHGSPYRRSVITNKQMMVSVTIMTAICVYLTVAPAQWLANFMELKMPQDSLMCYIVLAIAAVNLMLALFFERFIIQFMMEERQMIPKFLKERVVRKTPHLMIKRQLSDSDYLNCEDVITFDRETATVTDSSSSEKDR